MIVIHLMGDNELNLNYEGYAMLEDLETGKKKWIDSSDKLAQYSYHQHFLKQGELSKDYFKKAGADLLHIRTDEDYVKILQKFFVGRNRPA